MFKFQRVFIFFAALLHLLFLADLGLAAASGDSDKNEWKFEAAAYLFATGITGDALIRDVNVDVDVGFDDIIDNLDIGGMGAFAGQKGPWSFLIDGAYLKISDDALVERNLLSAKFDVEFEQTILGGYAGYRFIDGITSDLVERASVDFLAGFRYNNLTGELEGDITLVGLSASATRDRTEDWVDPVIGLRTKAYFSDNLRLMIWGDYGGFGAGADSTWQTMGILGYTFQNGVDLFAGYRAFAFDYEGGSGSSLVVFDLVYHGPILGIGYQF